MNDVSKEFMLLTHGNKTMLEQKVNEALGHGWNILGYPFYANGVWCLSITRTTESEE